MKSKTKYAIILTLMVLALMASIVLSFVSLGEACGNDPSSGCSIVNTSDYEKTFGIKNAHIGLIAFPILIILALLEIKKPSKYGKRLLHWGIIAGSIFAIYFLYIQFSVLKALCPYCLVVDFGILISLGLLFFEDEK